MNTDPRTPEVAIDPASVSHPGDGSSVELVLRVTNPTAAVEMYEIQYFGVPPEWCHAPDSVVVDPNETVPIWVTLTPEVTSQRQPGPYPITFTVLPHGAPDASRPVDLSLVVEGTLSYEVRADPAKMAGRRGNFTLTIDNNGERTLNLAVSAADVEGRCRTRVESPITVVPHTDYRSDLRVYARRSSILGPPELFALTVQIEPQNESARWARTLDLEFEHRPLVGFRRAFVACFVAVLAALSIGGFIYGPRAVTTTATEVECQFDADYRSAPNATPVDKPECSGKPPVVRLTSVPSPAAAATTPEVPSTCTPILQEVKVGTLVQALPAEGVALRSNPSRGSHAVVTPGLAQGDKARIEDQSPRCDGDLAYWSVQRVSDGTAGWASDRDADSKKAILEIVQ